MKAARKMEIIKGNITSIEVKTSGSPYSSGSYSNTYITVDNTFTGWLRGQYPNLDEGDTLVVLYTRNKHLQRNRIQAYYNQTKNIG